ncbi:MAG: hypothetical protein AAGB24_03850 [Bacteroidota bacterium]
MKRFLCLLALVLVTITPLMAQQQTYRIRFEHFSESRGNQESGLITELPYSEVVLVNNVLGSNSGLGPTLNFHGTILVIDQMNVQTDGSIQIVVRREDGRDFFGYRPTLKAILSEAYN